MDLRRWRSEGDLAMGESLFREFFCWCFWLEKVEVKAMVPIIRLRRRNRTVGVNQLFIDAHIEDGIADADSSSILERERERLCASC